jgi:hypothetical protein
MASSQLPVLARQQKVRSFFKDPSWQRIWLATQNQKWRSLALVPADSATSIIDLAHALLDVGWQHRGTPMVVADLRKVTLAYADAVVEEVRRHVDSGELVLIALPPVHENPATIPIAQSADCALLCVGLGRSKMAGAEETIKRIGRKHFIGTLIVREPKRP